MPVHQEAVVSEDNAGSWLIRKGPLARKVNRSTYTLDRWVKQGKFPKPIFLTDGSPAEWRVRDVEAWLAKRSVARRRSYGFRGAKK
jgi:predicted DNA-binding transcriptional regulator AlpA